MMILLSCGTMPSAEGVSVPAGIKTMIPVSQPERGALISAVVLPTEPVTPVLNMLNPTLMSMKINIKPLVEENFFKTLDGLKPKLAPVGQIRIHYWSEDAHGRPIQLSGLLVFPLEIPGQDTENAKESTRIKNIPLLLLCHGTELLRHKVPSRLAGSERPLAILTASSGIAVAMPDYPGMGIGEGFHPYCHAESIANAGVDFIRAVRTWFNSPGPSSYYRLDDKLFIAGYSEGGLAAMAVLKQIETEYPDEFPVSACFPMAGPFDMSGSMRKLMADPGPIPSPYYLPFTVLGWASVYPEIHPSQMLKEEYLNAVMPLFDGFTKAKVINRIIAKIQGLDTEKAVASLMLNAPYLNALRNPEEGDLGHMLFTYLQENDLYDWPCSPDIPIYFMATEQDELVPFENSVKAYEAMSARSINTTFRKLDQETHENGAYEGYAVMYLTLLKMTGIN
jgi:pimeloyl-ACP methyl ester carboxylesterase